MSSMKSIYFLEMLSSSASTNARRKRRTESFTVAIPAVNAVFVILLTWAIRGAVAMSIKIFSNGFTGSTAEAAVAEAAGEVDCRKLSLLSWVLAVAAGTCLVLVFVKEEVVLELVLFILFLVLLLLLLPL